MAVESLLTLPEIANLPKGRNGDYKICYLPKGHPQRPYARASWAFEHRLIAEAILGRRLRKNEEVHHRDKRDDNNPFNLKVMSNVSHPRLHNPLLGEFRLCLHCGRLFYRPQCWIKQGRGLYCGRECGKHSPARVESARTHLTGRAPDVALNTYIAQQKDGGRSWASLAKELGRSISTVRDRYRWYRVNIEEVPHGSRA